MALYLCTPDGISADVRDTSVRLEEEVNAIVSLACLELIKYSPSSLPVYQFFAVCGTWS